MKRALRSVLGRLVYGTGLHGPLLRGRAVITAFHRVQDLEEEDGITIGPNEFDAFCEYANRYFEVISLPALLDRLRDRQDISGCMVITFDDGYEDNYSVAAPILQRYRLPATFFVATDLIGSHFQPDWDRKRGIRTQWMSWEQVRAMHAMGFDIGAHTRTHRDVTELSPGDIEEELYGSKIALEDSLGAEVRLFSYPYGGKYQFNAELREAVQTMGFNCCLSCHGGLVSPGSNPFDLHRVPVNRWYRDHWHLGIEILNDRRILSGRGAA